MINFFNDLVGVYGIGEMLEKVSDCIDGIEDIREDRSFIRLNNSLPLVVKMVNGVVLKFSVPGDLMVSKYKASNKVLEYLLTFIPIFSERKLLVAETFSKVYPNAKVKYIRQDYLGNEFEFKVSLSGHNYYINFLVRDGLILMVETSDRVNDFEIRKEIRPYLDLTEANLVKVSGALLSGIEF